VRIREQAERERTAALSSAPPEPEPATSPPVGPRDDRPRTTRRIPLRGAFRFGAGILYGDLPAVGPLLRATAALLGPRWRVEGEVSYAARRSIRWEDDLGRVSTRTVEVLTGLLRACPVFRVRRVEFPLCVGVEAGVLVTRGSPAGTQRGAFVAVVASTGVLVELNRTVALALPLIEGSVHAIRARFVSTDDTPGGGAIPRPLEGGVLGLRVVAGIEVRFPR
jgi:hypothetical protein